MTSAASLAPPVGTDLGISAVATSRGAARRRQRDRVVPWLALTAADTVAVATLARCFAGPGELAVVIPACVLAHLLAGGGRRLGTRLRSESGSRAPGAAGALGFLLALLLGCYLPLAAVDGHSLSFGLPLASSWHLLDAQLSSAWSIFSTKIAPVAEQAGLVVVAGWAAALVAVASEVLYADAGLPAILALVPAFDIVVFTGTLGTATGRALELVALAALALVFLVEAQGDQQPHRTVIRARVLGLDTTRRGKSDERPDRRPVSRWRVLPGVTVAAALAAGVVGPVIPGATSAPLVAWHGSGVGLHRGGSGSGGPGGGGRSRSHARSAGVQVSKLVQVAEEEIDNGSSVLFRVHSAKRTREVLFTLDRFNGESWSGIGSRPGGTRAVRSLATPPSRIARHPPRATPLSGGRSRLTQAVSIDYLGGSWLPSPGATTAVGGDGYVAMRGRDGPLVAGAPIQRGLSYDLSAVLATDEASVTKAQERELSVRGAPALDVELPRPVPRELSHLAHSITAGLTSPFEKALALQDYFLDSTNGYTYSLPSTPPSGRIADESQSYVALESFLFQTKTGYCQQFATAFAVLARDVGLPTRIAVGMLPGREIARDEFESTGSDVHAWPEVFFSGVGWMTFEPTPGGVDNPRVTSPRTGPAFGSTTVPHGGTTGSSQPAHNLAPAKSGGNSKGSGSRKANRHSRPARGASGALDVLLGLVALGALFVVSVPVERARRRRSERHDPRRATRGAWTFALSTLAAAGAHRRRYETHLEFTSRVLSLGLLDDQANDALAALARRMDRVLYGGPSTVGSPTVGSPTVGSPTVGSPTVGSPTKSDSYRDGEGSAAWHEARLVCHSARRSVAWWQRLLAIVDPRDFVQGG